MAAHLASSVSFTNTCEGDLGMAWKYHCGPCQAGTAWLTKDEAEQQGEEHRRSAHGGLIPNGEWFEEGGPGEDVTEETAEGAAGGSSSIAGYVVLGIIILIALKGCNVL
ncbi:hypothetical protein ACFV0D_01695 [Streptomyces sp. NPDC059556]|uniref:hypothetical protein n=1 Tax=Streptomyces sp. NPDC059556 TaxID=3346863 RepID=UPI00369E498E